MKLYTGEQVKDHEKEQPAVTENKKVRRGYWIERMSGPPFWVELPPVEELEEEEPA